MTYDVQFKPKALKDLEALASQDAARVLRKVELLRQDLSGNVKHLTNFTPSYRLRVGNFRVLFELENTTVMIYRVLHRREAYR
jgi:mRNA interferase RelE/StbE